MTIRLDGTAGRQAILPRSYAVGLMVAAGEAAALAERLLADTVAKQGVEAGALTIHADRGTSITSKPVALLLADLGVTKTITSGGKRKPAKADRVAGAGRGRRVLMAAVSLLGRGRRRCNSARRTPRGPRRGARCEAACRLTRGCRSPPRDSTAVHAWPAA